MFGTSYQSPFMIKTCFAVFAGEIIQCLLADVYWDQHENQLTKYWHTYVHTRDSTRFFDQVEQPCERSQNYECQSHFSVSKIGQIFQKILWRIFG